ncbi:MAG: FecR domain-containing protein [Chloroflexi bacterium]|nr:FecR domain-containing protein [Chloroflexota bacterium]
MANAAHTLPDNPYESVGRQAWIILWAAFILFLFLLLGIPFSINWYLHNATEPRLSQVETVSGTPLVIDSGDQSTTPVLGALTLREGQLIRTDENSRANVSIYTTSEAVNSLATIQLRSNSELLFQKARTPRFGISTNPDEIAVQLPTGRARITGDAVDDRDLRITILTPQSTIHLQNGSVAIAVSNDATEVSVRGGTAEVTAQGRTVVLSNGRRTVVPLGEPPSAPQASSQNFINNGDFSAALAGTWEVQSIVDARDPSSVIAGTVSVVESGGRMAAYFVREGEEDIHTETAIWQPLDVDVLDYDALTLRLDVRLISQSLPGGGIQSSEFPLMVRIDFIDLNGNAQFWTHGFYAVDPIANWPIRDGERIPNFVWYEYESPDFLNSETFPRPQKVTGIRVYASGHNYRSQVSGIELIAR